MHWWKVSEPEGSLAYQPQTSGGIRSWTQRIIIFTFLNGLATCIKSQAASILLPLPCSSSRLTFSDTFGWGMNKDPARVNVSAMNRCACWGVGNSWGSARFAPSAETLCSWTWKHALQGEPRKPQLCSPSWDDFWLNQAWPCHCVKTTFQQGLFR